MWFKSGASTQASPRALRQANNDDDDEEDEEEEEKDKKKKKKKKEKARGGCGPRQTSHGNPQQQPRQRSSASS